MTHDDLQSLLGAYAINLIAAEVVTADGRTLVSGDHDGVLKLWDPRTGQEKGTLHSGTDAVIGLAFASSGGVLTAVSSTGWSAGLCGPTIEGLVGQSRGRRENRFSRKVRTP